MASRTRAARPAPRGRLGAFIDLDLEGLGAQCASTAGSTIPGRSTVAGRSSWRCRGRASPSFSPAPLLPREGETLRFDFSRFEARRVGGESLPRTPGAPQPARRLRLAHPRELQRRALHELTSPRSGSDQRSCLDDPRRTRGAPSRDSSVGRQRNRPADGFAEAGQGGKPERGVGQRHALGGEHVPLLPPASVPR